MLVVATYLVLPPAELNALRSGLGPPQSMSHRPVIPSQALLTMLIVSDGCTLSA